MLDNKMPVNKTRKKTLSMKQNSNICGSRPINSKTFKQRLYSYSTPLIAQRMAYKYLGKNAKLYPATKIEKKYSICDPIHKKWINFGQLGYEDYTKHHDKKRRKNYLTRTKFMKGDWAANKYSANNLSRNILW